MTDKENEKLGKQVVTYAGIIIVALIVLVMWGCPHYAVWKASVDAQAEVERAKGAAEANRILGLTSEADTLPLETDAGRTGVQTRFIPAASSGSTPAPASADWVN